LSLQRWLSQRHARTGRIHGLVDVDQFSGLRAILSGPAGGVVGYALTSYDPVSKSVDIQLRRLDCHSSGGCLKDMLVPAGSIPANIRARPVTVFSLLGPSQQELIQGPPAIARADRSQ
jgi:hypothetical protein